MATLQLVGPDDSTVLFDFIAPAGAGNPSTVITRLTANPDFGTLQPELNVMRTSAPGGQLLGATQPPVEVTIPFTASATTYTNLAAGLGQLARYLVQAKPWSPVTLKWVEDSTTRFMDIIGAQSLPTLLRGQDTAGIVATRKNTVGPITLTLLRQPWMRAAEVTVTGVTVPNDPATSTKVRVFPLTVSGDLPTPGRIRVQVDTGATVERTLIAHRAQGNKASSVMSDYLSDTGFAQVEANGRGWTRTLGTDTTATTDSTASPGSGTSKAVTTFATNTDLVERVKLTRTTLMDSLRGAWDVHARVKASAAGVFPLELRWSPAATGEAVYALPVVTHDTTNAAAFGWVELNLGTIHIPEGAVALGGLQLRLFMGADSATPDLDSDLVWLVPHDHQGTVVVPNGGISTWLGSQLLTPPTSPGGLGTGVVAGSEMKLDANGDAAGTPPNAGIAMPVGRHRVTFVVRNNLTTDCDLEVRLRNVTDSASVPASSFTLGNKETRTEVLTFDTIAAKFYQLQVVNTEAAASDLRVVSITEEYLPTLGTNESFRTEPGDRYGIDRLDTSGNLAGYLTVEGEIPAWLEPGLNHLMVRCDDVAKAGYEEGENILARTPTVSVLYSPRYAL